MTNSLQEQQHPAAVSWTKRMEVVARYMLLGNMRLVSEQMNISYDTLTTWKSSSWWPEMVEQLRRQKQSKRNENIVRLIEQSLEVMEDRLTNGDYVFDQKTGQILRKPVNIKDATTIATNLLQRQHAQEELEQKINIKTNTVQETLTLIAQELKKHNRITGPVEDAKVLEHAIYEKREEGLQTGSGFVHEQTGSNQETSGTEQGSSDDGESRESS